MTAIQAYGAVNEVARPQRNQMQVVGVGCSHLSDLSFEDCSAVPGSENLGLLCGKILTRGLRCIEQILDAGRTAVSRSAHENQKSAELFVSIWRMKPPDGDDHYSD